MGLWKETCTFHLSICVLTSGSDSTSSCCGEQTNTRTCAVGCHRLTQDYGRESPSRQTGERSYVFWLCGVSRGKGWWYGFVGQRCTDMQPVQCSTVGELFIHTCAILKNTLVVNFDQFPFCACASLHFREKLCSLSSTLDIWQLCERS